MKTPRRQRSSTFEAFQRLLLFNKGEVIARKVGAVSQSHLRAFLDGQLREAVA